MGGGGATWGRPAIVGESMGPRAFLRLAEDALGNTMVGGSGTPLGWIVRVSDTGTPASSMSVADVLRINFASFQSSPVLCCKLTR